MRQDGVILTRYPRIYGQPLRLPPEVRLWQGIAAGRAAGSFLSVLPVTGERVLVAYRHLEEYPTLYAVAALPRDMIVNAWWREVWHVPGFGLMAMVALALLIWRMARQQTALLGAKAELEARVAQLADEGQRLSLALEANDLGFWELDVQRGKIWHFKRLRQMLGLPDTAAWTDHPGIHQQVHPDDADRLKEAYMLVLHGKSRGMQLELRLRSPSGEWAWFETFGRVVRRNPVTGAAQILTGVTRDISARKEAEARR